MNIGSLFVSLGVKGANKTLSAIVSVKNGLRDTALIANQTVSLFERIYGGVRNMSENASNYAGNLNMLSNQLGVSVEQLQRWDYAARKAGAQSGQMFNAFDSLQKVLLQVRDNGAPEYFQYLFNQMSQIDSAFDSQRFETDVNYAMESVAKLAQGATGDLARLNQAFSSIGIPPELLNALRKGDLNLGSITRDMLVDEGDIQTLERIRGYWVEIDGIVQKSFVNVAKTFDEEFVKSIKELIISLSELLTRMLELAKEFRIIERATVPIRAVTRSLSDSEYAKRAASNTFGNFFGSSATGNRKAEDEFIRRMNEIKGTRPNQPITINNNITTQDDPLSIANGASDGTQSGIRDSMMEFSQ